MPQSDVDTLIFLIDDRFNKIIKAINNCPIIGLKKRYNPLLEQIYKKYDLYKRDMDSMSEDKLESLYEDINDLYKKLNKEIEKADFRKPKKTKSLTQRKKCKCK